MLEAREIRRARARIADEDVNGRRHQRKFRHALRLDVVEYARGIELTHHDGFGAVIECRDAPAGAADMSDGRGDEADVLWRPDVPRDVGGCFQGVEHVQQIAMADHRAFGPSRRAGGVKLDGDVVGTDNDARADGIVPVTPWRIERPVCMRRIHGHDQLQVRQARSDRFGHRFEACAHKQSRRAAIFHDGGDLRQRQTPVHRRDDGAGFRGTQQQFEIAIGVATEINDATVRRDASGNETRGHAVRMRLQLFVGGQTAFERERHGVRSLRGVKARDVTQRGKARHHELRRRRTRNRPGSARASPPSSRPAGRASSA